MPDPLSRVKLLLVLATMPDEAFGWFVAWALGPHYPYPAHLKLPENLGGFVPASRRAIEALQAAARAYVEHP